MFTLAGVSDSDSEEGEEIIHSQVHKSFGMEHKLGIQTHICQWLPYHCGMFHYYVHLDSG